VGSADFKDIVSMTAIEESQSEEQSDQSESDIVTQTSIDNVNRGLKR
jgi:hypothetical protein